MLHFRDLRNFLHQHSATTSIDFISTIKFRRSPLVFLYLQALEGKDIKDLLTNVGSGGPAAAAPAAAAGGAAAPAEAAEEKKEEGMCFFFHHPIRLQSL